MRRSLIVLAVAGLGLGHAGSTQAADDVPAASGTENPAANKAFAYTVRFDGPIDDGLRGLLDNASQAVVQEDRPPPSRLALQRRADSDIDALRQVLRARGYFQGSVAADVRQEPANPPPSGLDLAGFERFMQGVPWTIVFTVDPGTVFRFRDITVMLEPPGTALAAPTPPSLGLVAGEPALSAKVIDAEEKLLERARDQGYAFAVLGDRRALIENAAHAMDVVLLLKTGPASRFGAASFTGDNDVNERFLQRRMTWRQGDMYNAAVLDQARRDLVDTGLFASVRVRLPDGPAPDGLVPVTFELTPRKPRSVGAGVFFGTDTGPGLNAFWEHRNVFGGGERFRIEGEASRILSYLNANYRRPDFLRRNLSLILDADARLEDTDAFYSRSVTASTGVEYLFDRRRSGTLGVAYRKAHVDQAGEVQDYALVSLPGTFFWDGSNDKLDPTGGARLRLEAAPFVDVFGETSNFLKARATYSHYLTLLPRQRLVLALRGSVGTIVGSDTADVPADLRYYAGGGGSIRGIGYQLASPLNANNDPTGGRSLLELNSELRFGVTESIDAVAFLDAGDAAESELPGFEDIRLGTGVGMRYRTPIGPIRLDVAVPIDRRPGIDDAFQIYLSIGQAF